MKKRLISIILCSALTICALPLMSVRADALRNIITDSDNVSGSNYTDSPALADKLDAIFEGNAGVYYNYSCTSLVDTPLGSSPVKNNGIYMYASPVNNAAVDIGTSCWIYAQGVYHTLFGESTDGSHSENLYLGGTGSRALTYHNLCAWGVRPVPGALIRASGHSMILLHYDADTITYIDGNGNGNGLVAVRVYSWDQMGDYVEYIVQPESDHYADLYKWGLCGKDAFWTLEQSTLTLSGSGEVLQADWKDYCDTIDRVIIQGKSLTIGDGIFADCVNLKSILFQDAAPQICDNAFLGVSAMVRYPVNKAGWTETRLCDYGGNLSWIPYGMTELRITSQPQSISVSAGITAEVSVSAEGDGLAYCWYTKDADQSIFVKSSASGPVYAMMMGEDSQSKQVMCVITDRYGNSVTSQIAHLRVYDADRYRFHQAAQTVDAPYFR